MTRNTNFALVIEIGYSIRSHDPWASLATAPFVWGKLLFHHGTPPSVVGSLLSFLNKGEVWSLNPHGGGARLLL